MDFPNLLRLHEWSWNYDLEMNPFCIFLDLIGWSHEEIGEPLYKGNPKDVLGYLELEMLIDALIEYRDAPDDEVWDFIAKLLHED